MPSESDFSIPRNRYVAFDAESWKGLILDRLKQTDHFNRQSFEGSNWNFIADIIAITFSNMTFMLNQTSSNGMFSQTQLYSAMNDIVRELDYRPVGYQTSTLSFRVSASSINAGLYTIPRYSYIRVGGRNYSFSEDITFRKTTDQTEEELEELSNTKLLYQGTWIEYPIITANGNENETLFLEVGDAVVDHNNIEVYVKSIETGVWKKWEETQTLFLAQTFDEFYEKRLNAQKVYELEFGNNIKGKKLSEGDQVAIYFLQSDGTTGQVAANTIGNADFVVFSTPRLTQIFGDINTKTATALPSSKNVLAFSNTQPSTPFTLPESIEEIRRNAPSVARSQYTLTTPDSYESYIRSNFRQFVHDSRVVGNRTYLDTYFKYFYDLGLTDPGQTNRALFNQVTYADANNANNVYMFVVPKVTGYLGQGQKSFMIQRMEQEKTLTAQLIPQDPIYISFDLAVPEDGSISLDDADNTELIIVKEDRSLRSSESIIDEASQIFTNYFERENNQLGQFINLNQLSTDLFGIEGVAGIFSQNKINGNRVEGISMIRWNPVYPWKIDFVNNNLELEYFMFPVLNNPGDIASKILVEDKSLGVIGIGT